MDDIAQFDFPTDSPKIIKVIGGSRREHRRHQGHAERRY